MSGGIKTILENIKVENLIVSRQKEEYENFKEIVEIANKRKVNVVVVRANDKIVLDKSAYIKILYPTESLPHSDINNNSIVAKFISQNTSILFTRRYRKRSRRKFTQNIWKSRIKIRYFKSGTSWFKNFIL